MLQALTSIRAVRLRSCTPPVHSSLSGSTFSRARWLPLRRSVRMPLWSSQPDRRSKSRSAGRRTGSRKAGPRSSSQLSRLEVKPWDTHQDRHPPGGDRTPTREISARQHVLAVEKTRLVEQVRPLRLDVASPDLAPAQLRTKNIAVRRAARPKASDRHSSETPLKSIAPLWRSVRTPAPARSEMA